MIFLKLKKCETFNKKKTHLIIHAIYLLIKMIDYYIQINIFYIMKITKHPIIIKKK